MFKRSDMPEEFQHFDEKLCLLLENKTQREVDYEIAHKIMKLPVASERRYNTGKEVFFTDAPYFSSSMADAMKILDFLQAKGFMWSLNGSSEGGFWCVLYPPIGDYVETEICDTPEEAICRAALQLTLEVL